MSWRKHLPSIVRLLVASLFVFAGGMHFIKAAIFEAVVPEWVPFPAAAVVISGIAEIAFGLGLLSIRTRRPCGIGLILLLVAVFPANINMAVHPEKFPQFPQWLLLGRLPLQFALIWLVHRVSR